MTLAYCTDQCKLLLKMTKVFRSCAGCGLKDEDKPLVIWARTEQYEQQKAIGVEFAASHIQCRADAQEPRGPEMECQCSGCRRDRGDPQRRPVHRTGQRRATNYEAQRAAVYERDRLICQICLLPTAPDASVYDDRRPVLDHIIRVADGGSDDVENLRTAHRWCNAAIEGPGIHGLEPVVRERAIVRFAGMI